LIVLDLCCAPGSKLCYISDYFKFICKTEDYKVTGVDISQERLFICKSQLQKYKIENTRLILGDGTKFFIDNESKPFQSKNLKKLFKRENFKQKISNSGILFHQTKGIFHLEHIENEKKKRKNPNNEISKKQKLENDSNLLTEKIETVELYDKVLVDAECSTDGSVKHILQLDQSGWKNFETIYSNPERLKWISDLQKKLIHNGFKLLKPDGHLVYSTCSFLKDQNEDVIRWLLEKEPTAKICQESLVNEELKYKEGGLKGTIRLDPLTSNTSGFFLCKIKKSKI
jgi:16S rRNA C967 or C1407 C5-methylase (RsmB/RsmF family)